jgi:probable rRNA maturation factor
MNQFCLRNRQRAVKVNGTILRRIGRHLLRHLPCTSGHEVGVYLVEREEISRINWTFLRHAGPTDVITFDHRPESGCAVSHLYGEIYICPEEAQSNAHRFHTAWPEELVRYLVHGILHLQGLDDATPSERRKMRRHENKWLKSLAREFPLSQISLNNTVKP